MEIRKILDRRAEAPSRRRAPTRSGDADDGEDRSRPAVPADPEREARVRSHAERVAHEEWDAAVERLPHAGRVRRRQGRDGWRLAWPKSSYLVVGDVRLSICQLYDRGIICGVSVVPGAAPPVIERYMGKKPAEPPPPTPAELLSELVEMVGVDGVLGLLAGMEKA